MMRFEPPAVGSAIRNGDDHPLLRPQVGDHDRGAEG